MPGAPAPSVRSPTGGWPVQCSSAARCPSTFSTVSPGSVAVHDRSADRCSGNHSPVRSPFLRECNGTVQCRYADRCSGTYSPVRSPFLRECNRTVQIWSVPHGTFSMASLFSGHNRTTDLMGAIRHLQYGSMYAQTMSAGLKSLASHDHGLDKTMDGRVISTQPLCTMDKMFQV